MATQPIRSFYLEHYVAAADIRVGETYPYALTRLLGMLAQQGPVDLYDPMGVSDVPFTAVRTAKQRKLIQRVAHVGWKRAYQALDYEQRRRPVNATRLWNLVFNKRFLI